MTFNATWARALFRRWAIIPILYFEIPDALLSNHVDESIVKSAFVSGSPRACGVVRVVSGQAGQGYAYNRRSGARKRSGRAATNRWPDRSAVAARGPIEEFVKENLNHRALPERIRLRADAIYFSKTRAGICGRNRARGATDPRGCTCARRPILTNAPDPGDRIRRPRFFGLSERPSRWRGFSALRHDAPSPGEKFPKAQRAVADRVGMGISS